MVDDSFAVTDSVRIVSMPHRLTKSEAISVARDHDVVVVEGRVRVDKYHSASDTAPYEVFESEPNLALTAGMTLMWQLAAGLGGTAWSSANARIAVGTGTTAAVAGNTTLQTETARVIVDSAPNVSGASISFVATFGAGIAAVNWREIGVVNASSTGTLLNRLVQDMGTKSSTAVWIATVTLTAS